MLRETPVASAQATDMDSSSLLDELDRRQNEVLDQLAALNARIEALVSEWTQQRAAEEAAAATGEAEPATAAASGAATPSGPGVPTSRSRGGGGGRRGR